MSEVSAFGVDHGAVISKRGGKLARILGRGAAKTTKPSLLPNGKTIQQTLSAPGPKPPKGAGVFSGSGPTAPKPRPAPKPKYVDPTAPTPAQKTARNDYFKQQRMARQTRTRTQRTFRSNGIERTDGPLG